eukprot:SM000033S12321  [mRNA]  locus=s33:142660:151351:+ [translate_table: standard]
MSPPKKMVAVPILEAGVRRWDASEAARRSAAPSFSFADAATREAELPDMAAGDVGLDLGAASVPHCRLENGQQVVTIKLPAGTSFYGTGETGGSLERTGRRIVGWNTDAWGYGRSTSSLYQSHPWVLAVLPDGSVLGVLADTTRRVEVDLRKEGVIRFAAPGAYPVVTFGPFSTPEAVLTSLSHAIGEMPMPAKWTLGYHQCRWSYETADRVLEVAREFRERRIPCDVIWMDIDYMDGFRCFTFDPKKFPDPEGLAADLHAQGFKAVWMIDPGIARDEGYSVFRQGTEQDVWVQRANGQPFVGNVWPGPCVFPDYTAERVRKWWADLICKFSSRGVDGIWNDMNEPAVFNTISKTMPENNVHRGDKELGGKQSHAHYHNVYGMLMARSTFEGMRLADPDRRPFVLTRAAYIGSQRVSVDNPSLGQTLAASQETQRPVFLPDPKDPKLREIEDCFLLGNLLVAASTDKRRAAEPGSVVLPAGIWQRFHFDDSHPDLPLLYLRGGSIVPTGPPHQSVTECSPEDPVTLLIALDSQGKAEGQLFEDSGDGYGFQKGKYLLTTYSAAEEGGQLHISVKAVEGSLQRPRRALRACLLLGECTQVEAEGVDGEPLVMKLPDKNETETMVTSTKEMLQHAVNGRGLEDDESREEQLEQEPEFKTFVELAAGDWLAKVAPWIGGRIISLIHAPTGREWLEAKLEQGGYEEYSGPEYRAVGCTEPYEVVKRTTTPKGVDSSVTMEGDIGGGLVLLRTIQVPSDDLHRLCISSSIEARAIGAGAGGFSRPVCLRAHPSFKLPHTAAAVVRFTAIDGSTHELRAEFGEAVLKGTDRPNGEWMLVDLAEGAAIVSRFDVGEVEACMVHWGGGYCNLELWSPERPVSKDTPLHVAHSYEAHRVAKLVE